MIGFKPKDGCPNADRCGRTGHYFREEVGMVRCECMELFLMKQTLGQFYCENPAKRTPLSKMVEKNIVTESPMATLRPHIARVILDAKKDGKSVQVIDAYRLIEIFLEKDDEFNTSMPIVEKDLLIILLGFGDPRNRYLPELLLQVLSRRELMFKPTWVILGESMNRLSSRYSVSISDKVQSFQKVEA